MDPLSALSVAGTIIQFVDFGRKLLSGSVELYRSSQGCLEIHQELELVTSSLKSVAIKIRSASSESFPGQELSEENHQREEDSLHAICDEAARIADELLSKLASLKIKGQKNRVWESLKAVIKAAWTKEEIGALSRRLSCLRDAMNTRTIFSLGQKLDAETVRSSARFDTLDTQTQQILQALVDKRKDFPGEIINSIAKMLCRMETVNQSEHHKTRLMIAYQNSAFGHTPSVGDITAHIEMLDVEDKEEQRLRGSIQKTILDSLRYPNMTDRYEDLVEAHPQTFDWVFRDPNQGEELPWSSFGQWLREGKGIYWVNGKAGSGKSTLMKHIYDDRLTKKFLLDWSSGLVGGPIPCCVATFFFWNSGTDMQKSIQGLLRSLLFQVLGSCPDLIPAVFPARWASLYAAASSSPLWQEVEPDSFSLRQLHDAFEKMVEQKYVPLKICFLIDGLDEFSGNTMELCSLLVQLAARTETAKFCLSSRPWVEFQRGFKVCPGLKLQDLTSKDIERYIKDRFSADPDFTDLAQQNEKLVSLLIQETIDKAEGVFLWVTIVVNQLLRGIKNEDSVSMLLKRLYGFPRELGPLYDKILSDIEDGYLTWASRAFQIMNTSTELSSDPFHKRVKSTEQANSSKQELNTVQEQGRLQGVNAVTLIEWFFALDYDNNVDVNDSKQLKKTYDTIDKHLAARCSGLLEVSRLSKDKGGEVAFRQIRWMHRTARDFMNENVKWANILEKEGTRDFSPSYSLMRGSIMSLSVQARSGSDGLILTKPVRYSGWASNAWFYAYHANGHATSRKDRTQLLRLLRRMRTRIPSTFSSSVPPLENIQHRRGIGKLFPESDRAFLVRASNYCLSDFVEDILLQSDWEEQRRTAIMLMRQLCDKERVASIELPFPTVHIINSLIKLGQYSQRQFVSNESPKRYDSGEDDSDDSDDAGDVDMGDDDIGEDDSEDEDEESVEGEESVEDGSGEHMGGAGNDSSDDEEDARDVHDAYEEAKRNAENTKIYPLELWSFFDSQLSIIQAFIKAGVDPKDAFTYIPNDFIFRENDVREILVRKLQQGCEDVDQAQKILEETLREAIEQQKESGLMCSKRKVDNLLRSEESTVSDIPGFPERIAGEESFVKRRKRMDLGSLI